MSCTEATGIAAQASTLIASVVGAIEEQLQSSGWNGAVGDSRRIVPLLMRTSTSTHGLDYNISASLDDLLLDILIKQVIIDGKPRSAELSRLAYKKA